MTPDPLEKLIGIVAHFDLHGIEGVEELTEEQFKNLLPTSEES
jgi:hypothetical protein